MRHLLLLTIFFLIGCGSHLSPEQVDELEKAEASTKDAVTNWILEHAKYPDSYESISYSDYIPSWGARNGHKIPDSEWYEIKHTHKILDKDSVLTTFSGYFILDHEFDIRLIEQERTTSKGGFPPQTEIWMKEFGRALNEQDSIRLKEKERKLTKQLVKEVKQVIEDGNIEDASPEDLKKLQNALDSVEQKN